MKNYRGAQLNRVAFPMGGIGAGMVCLEGTGAFSHVSLRHQPDVFNEPYLMGALYVKGAPTARVLEGPVPARKAFGESGSAQGSGHHPYGFPRFAKASFTTRFPFGTVALQDPAMPVAVEATGWSPFIPGDADASSLPVAAVEYRFVNRTSKPVEAVFSFHAMHFMKKSETSGWSILPLRNGLVLSQPPLDQAPEAEGHFALFTREPARVDCAWFRGGWFDPVTMLWRTVMAGGGETRPPYADGQPGRGGSLYVPFRLKPHAARTLHLLMAWYVPTSTLRLGDDQRAVGTGGGACGGTTPEGYRPWYAGRFNGIGEVADYWRRAYPRLRGRSQAFSDCFYDTTLPEVVVDAVASNLTILKSPTCLRQTDGRFWAWEGCSDAAGCCHGSCTHVWNYAQALPSLFPELERSLREIEFRENQAPDGHQNFRAFLPVRTPDHDFHAAADGQLGGLMKLYREWRISGDTAWMKSLWPRARASLDFCIRSWDPDHTGTLREPHHNTYDIEFWGADGMCTSFYLGALKAALVMGKACRDEVDLYATLLERGRQAMDAQLWNGEYYFQQVQWTGLCAGDPATFKTNQATYRTPEALAVLQQEGPKYQYGTGCLSDGVLGEWLAQCCGLGAVLDPERTARHVRSVFRYNFRPSLVDHSNPQRPSFALGREGGLLLCSWPHGGKPRLPFVYSDEVWTGIEYAVASHLFMMGQVRPGLAVVRAVRKRYDGTCRNPFDEYECGHWYARALSSYAMIQGLTGARYDAVERVLYLAPSVQGDFRAFLSTATGFGTVGLRKGKPFLEVKSGRIPVRRIVVQGKGKLHARSKRAGHPVRHRP